MRKRIYGSIRDTWRLWLKAYQIVLLRLLMSWLLVEGPMRTRSVTLLRQPRMRLESESYNCGGGRNTSLLHLFLQVEEYHLEHLIGHLNTF
jgi:hypothetical protein